MNIFSYTFITFYYSGNPKDSWLCSLSHLLSLHRQPTSNCKNAATELLQGKPVNIHYSDLFMQVPVFNWFIFLCADGGQPHRETSVWDQREQVSKSVYLCMFMCCLTWHHFILSFKRCRTVPLIFFFTNRRLLEKSQRIEAILASLQASGAEPEQLTEVEEMITAPEKQQLDALRLHINK